MARNAVRKIDHPGLEPEAAIPEFLLPAQEDLRREAAERRRPARIGHVHRPPAIGAQFARELQQ